MSSIFKLIISWLLSYFLIRVLSWLIPQIQVGDFLSFGVFLLILLFVNKIINPILQFFSFPITILTLGLFSVIINFWCLWLAIITSGAINITANGLGWLGCMILISAALSFANNFNTENMLDG
jgi:putative membrane protein